MAQLRYISGYKGQYSASKDGKIFSHKRNRFLNPVNLKGYKRVKLRDFNNNQKVSNKLVHRLIAETFLDNPNNKLEVNHINNKRDDNRIENLEWATISENNQHAWTYGNKIFVKTDKFVKSVRNNIKKAINKKRGI
jgi:predicted N-acyltransferase